MPGAEISGDERSLKNRRNRIPATEFHHVGPLSTSFPGTARASSSHPTLNSATRRNQCDTHKHPAVHSIIGLGARNATTPCITVGRAPIQGAGELRDGCAPPTKLGATLRIAVMIDDLLTELAGDRKAISQQTRLEWKPWSSEFLLECSARSRRRSGTTEFSLVVRTVTVGESPHTRSAVKFGAATECKGGLEPVGAGFLTLGKR
jgi:hypothetical protein